MKREVLTCDVCDRELPLIDRKGQIIHEVKRGWHWPSFGVERREPDHVCEDCWNGMVTAARKARELAAGSTAEDTE